MKTMDDYEFSGKRVLLRIDINSPVVNGKIQDNPRIKEHSETIKELSNKEARVIILAHQGRPGDKDFTGLEQHSKLLEKYVGKKIFFVDDIIGKKAKDTIDRMKNGDIVLLDNVRSLADEKEPEDSSLVKNLLNYGDIFINDAFSVSHRKHASVVGFKKLLPSFAGRLMEKELKALKELEEAIPPVVIVLGGAKPENSIKLMEGKLKYDIILTGGIIGQLFLISKGHNLGTTRDFLTKNGYDKFLIKMKKIESENKKIITPLDVAYDDNGRKEAIVLKLPSKGIISDIGKETMEEYSSAIKYAGTVIMNGWMGIAEDEKFSKGTEKILRAIAESNAYSLVCGGHTTEFIDDKKIPRTFSHISLAGGAMLTALSGEKLPGVDALD